MSSSVRRTEVTIGLAVIRRQSPKIWWSLRTRLEQCLLCGWSFVSILFFSLSVIIIIFVSFKYNTSKSLVCLTNECINSANRIMEYIDKSVPPCHDFYRFACGKWLDSTAIPSHRHSVSSLSLTQDKIDHKLKELLEQSINESDSQTLRNMKNMYNSCMNSTIINGIGFKPLNKYLKLMGGWPVVEGNGWNDTNFDLIDSFANIRTFGFKQNFFFQLRVAPNMTENTRNKIYIIEPIFSSLTRHQLIESNDQIEDYLDFMTNIAVLLGAEYKQGRKEMKEVIKFETLIARSIKSNEKYRYLKIKELNEKSFNEWFEVINGLLSLNISLNENEIIIVSNHESLRVLTNIFGKYQTNYRQKRVLANFIIWKIISQSINGLDQRFTRIQNKFLSKTRPLFKTMKRWKFCLKSIGANMKVGLTSLYLTSEKDKQKKKHLVNEMFENLVKTLTQMIDENDWIDDETRSSAKFKIHFFNKFIAFADQMLDQNEVNAIHEKLEELKSDEYFENLLRLQKWNSNNEYSKLRQINDRNDWQNTITSPVVNAYYSPLLNGIKIPIWILQGIFFGTDRPKYLNYGSMGWIIGHELTHPFDTIGGRFDKRGNLRDWWDVWTKNELLNKSNCFVNQYKTYDNFNLTKRYTLSEDIADNGGIEMAFQTYRKYVKTSEEPTLPALDYTTDQLFFISAAQIWCTKHTREGFKSFVENSIHSPPQQRILVSFSNTKHFSNVFKCKENDRMNPKDKCKIW